MALEAGSSIGGRYMLVQALDRGGMGTVWEARDVSGGTVAIKFLSYSVANPAALRRFRREAQALEQLDHPNVVRMIDHGLEDNVPFIAMELLQGQSLRSLLQKGALRPQRALEVLRDAARGLGAAHALGIIHRDVKPSNLFLCNEETTTVTKLIDFGIATGDPFETDSQASTTGMIGSPAYMSPEQARGERLDRSADVWSLAVVAFQMLTGREPFTGANIPETLQRICSGRIPRASEMASGLPAGTDKLFQRAFAHERSARFADVEELRTALDAVYRAAPDVAAISLGRNRTGGRNDTTVSLSSVAARVVKLPTDRRSRTLVVALAASAALALGLVPKLRELAEARPVQDPERASQSSSNAVATPAATRGVAPADPVATAVAEPSQSPAAPAGSAQDQPTRPKPASRVLSRAPQKPEALTVPSSQPQTLSSTQTSSAIAPELDPVFGLRVSKPDAKKDAMSAGSDARDGDDVHRELGAR